MNKPAPSRTSVTPSSPGSRPSPPGGLRPALTPAPGDVHRQLWRGGCHKRSTKSGLHGFRGLPRRRIPVV